MSYSFAKIELEQQNQIKQLQLKEFSDSIFKNKTLDNTQTSSLVNTTLITNNSIQQNVNQVLSIIREKGNQQCGVTQNDLLRDILFTLQNIQNNNIQLINNFYHVRSNLPISQSARKLITHICQLGWIYKRINQFLHIEGYIGTAFVQAVKQQFTIYYKWLAIIQNLLKNNQLSMRKMILWTVEPLQRLKWISILTQSVSSYHGSQVISIINCYRPQGLKATNQLIKRIIRHTLCSFKKYIDEWIQKGVLNDPHHQFFIELDQVSNQNMWSKKYKFIIERIPNVINIKTAQQIFQTGKTINFLKQCCHIDYNGTLPSLQLDQMINLNRGQESYRLSNKFMMWIQQANQNCCKSLIDLLFNKFMLKTHLNTIKKILLMGQGDFIHNLMEIAYDQLGKIASQLFRHNLLALLQGAIRVSNTQFMHPDIIKRIDFKLIQTQRPGSTGWDCFSLIYHVQQPLNTLFSSKIMQIYISIFNLLWRVKRIQYNLTKVWINHMKIQINNDETNKKLKFCNLLRNAMMHFIVNLFNYLMVAIQSAWKNFMDNLEVSKSFQQIIQLHSKFLEEVLDKIFLLPKYQQINQKLCVLFQIILRFKDSQQIILTNIQENLQKERYQRNKERIAQLTNERKKDQQVKSSNYFGNQTFKNVQAIQKQFTQNFRYLFDMLHKHSEKFRFLIFRLDFNQYYSSIPNCNYIKQIDEKYRGF